MAALDLLNLLKEFELITFQYLVMLSSIMNKVTGIDIMTMSRFLEFLCAVFLVSFGNHLLLILVYVSGFSFGFSSVFFVMFMFSIELEFLNSMSILIVFGVGVLSGLLWSKIFSKIVSFLDFAFFNGLTVFASMAISDTVSSAVISSFSFEESFVNVIAVRFNNNLDKDFPLFGVFVFYFLLFMIFMAFYFIHPIMVFLVAFLAVFRFDKIIPLGKVPHFDQMKTVIVKNTYWFSIPASLALHVGLFLLVLLEMRYVLRKKKGSFLVSVIALVLGSVQLYRSFQYLVASLYLLDQDDSFTTTMAALYSLVTLAFILAIRRKYIK